MLIHIQLEAGCRSLSVDQDGGFNDHSQPIS